MMKTDEHVRALSDYVLRLALLHASTALGRFNPTIRNGCYKAAVRALTEL